MAVPLCLESSCPISGLERVCLAVSEPSLDNARGVRGGVFFLRGGTTSSVSLVDSRCELKEESAESAGESLLGESSPVEDFKDVGFEMLVA